MPDRQLRVLIADDSISFRAVLARVCADIEGVEVVGSAYNGRAAIEKAGVLKPDLVTLDIDMPEMDGLEVLQRIKSSAPDAFCVMITSLSGRSAELTLKALSLGALDLIVKPSSPDMEANFRELSRQMRALIQMIRTKKHVSTILEGRDVSGAVRHKVQSVVFPPLQASGKEVVAIAISTGGPEALSTLIPSIPGNLGVPIFIVQHMPPCFTGILAESLNRKSALIVKEAESGEFVKAGTVYVAPGGRHMKVDLHPVSREKVIVITDAPPENFCRPSADYLFRALASIYGEKVMAIIMTGMGDDGVNGLRALKKRGAHVIAQDEETSVVFGMARVAIEAEVVDTVLPLGQIAEAVIACTRRVWN